MQIDQKSTPAKCFLYSPMKKKINFTHVNVLGLKKKEVLGLFQDCKVVCSNGYEAPTMNSTLLFCQEL